MGSESFFVEHSVFKKNDSDPIYSQNDTDPIDSPEPMSAIPRRTLVLGLPSLGCCWGSARAGSQAEERLADSVRSALSAAVLNAPPPDPPSAFAAEERLAYRHWMVQTVHRLHQRKADMHTRLDFSQTLWYEAKRAALDPALVLGLIEVESGFRKYAVSTAGALGYMQVMPFWTRVIGDGQPHRLFHTQTNLRFGCVILRHYLDVEKGDLSMALGRYNGTRGQMVYPHAVMSARQRWLV
jgi:soluble lytic murein transglycosylase-like protein